MAEATADDLVDPPPARTTSFIASPMGKKFVLGTVIAVVLAAMVAVWMWSQQPEYRVLFANVSDKDGGAITAALEKMGVPYRFSEGGTAIMVPNENVHDVRLKLAAQGLPKGGNVGFELMENQKLGVSQFHEQVNYQRSLEGELARSIESVASVSSARVHLALPKPSVFVREQQKPTASVLLNMQTGRVLDVAQVMAITHLVASSVPELPQSNVTIVDQNGNLLSEQGKSAGKQQLDPNQLKYVIGVQQSIVKQVESLITPLVGEGNVRAEASADIDFAQVDTAAEIYKPNSPPEPQAIRSQQTSEASNVGPGAAGVPGALTNQPPGVAAAPIDGAAPLEPAAAGGGPVRKDATTNFEVDKTVRYEQKPMGSIKRLTVGVLVNYRRIVDPTTNKVTIKALTAAEVTQINNLVREAMGYSQQRGDTLNVTNAPFDGVDKPEAPAPETPVWKDKDNIMYAKELAKIALALLILGFLFFRFLRPATRPLIRKFDEMTAPPVPPPAGAKTAEERLEEEEAVEVELTQQVQGYRENLAMAKTLAKDDPRVVANVVKAWVGAE